MTHEWLTALASLAWPIIIVVLLWRIYPLIIRAVDRGSLKVKFGDLEISLEEASQSLFENMRLQIEDLQQRVESLLRGEPAQDGPPRPGAEVSPPARDENNQAENNPDASLIPRPTRILWVDDRPQSNASEIARLRDAGVEIVRATSTEDALSVLGSQAAPYDAVISDMRREENGIDRPLAGLELLDRIRADGKAVPVLIYCGRRNAKALRMEVAKRKGNGITASPIELFEMLADIGIPTLPAAS